MYTLLWYQSRSFFCSQEGLLLWGKKCIQRRGSEISNDCSTSFQRRKLVAVLLFFSLLLGERQRERDRGYCDFFPVKAFFASFRKTYCSFFKKKRKHAKNSDLFCLEALEKWRHQNGNEDFFFFSWTTMPLARMQRGNNARREINIYDRAIYVVRGVTEQYIYSVCVCVCLPFLLSCSYNFIIFLSSFLFTLGVDLKCLFCVCANYDPFPNFAILIFRQESGNFMLRVLSLQPAAITITIRWGIALFFVSFRYPYVCQAQRARLL